MLCCSLFCDRRKAEHNEYKLSWKVCCYTYESNTMDWMGNLVDNVQEDKSCNFDNRFHKIKVNENNTI